MLSQGSQASSLKAVSHQEGGAGCTHAGALGCLHPSAPSSPHPQTYEHNEWVIHLAGKLLANDAQALSLLARNPFEGRDPPR